MKKLMTLLIIFLMSGIWSCTDEMIELDNIYTSSNFFVLDLDADGCISGIVMKQGIEQI